VTHPGHGANEPSTADAVATGDGADPDRPDRPDRLDRLREEVRTVEDLPVGDRVAVFERVNDGIAAELARLDEA
jgi:hypothetical protein